MTVTGAGGNTAAGGASSPSNNSANKPAGGAPPGGPAAGGTRPLTPSITISPLPSISFVGGTAGTQSLAQFVRVPAGYDAPRFTLQGALPVGVSFDNQSGVLSYDGNGPAPQITNLSLAATADPLPDYIATLSLTSSAGGALLPWTVGHFFRQGDVPAGQSVRADIGDFQAEIRNRWPDGSVKFAVLSGRCDFTAGTPRMLALLRGVAAAGTPLSEANLVAASPNIVVQVGAAAVALTSVIGSPVRQLLQGPVASEWQYRLPVSGDSQLCVWLYVRLYKGGRVEFMASIENGHFDFTGAGNRVGRVVVTSGATTLYDSGANVDIKSHTRMVCASGHSGKLWIGGDPGIVPRHMSSYVQASAAVPAFQATSISDNAYGSFAQSYTPYAQHNLPGNQLGGAGDHSSIGWLPRWDACWAVAADPRAYRAVLVNSFASAAYSVHFRSGTTRDVVAYGEHPTVIRAQSAGHTVPGGRAFWSGQYGGDWDVSHGWLPGYTAYLLTGDYWHLEELQFYVKWDHYTGNVSYRGNATGLVVRNRQMRGVAWGLRNLGLCAALTPDDHPERANYVNAFGASMVWMEAYHTNALGVLTEPENWGDPGGHAFWESDYAVGSLCWIADMKLLAGAQQTAHQTLIQRVGAGLVKRYAAGSDPTGWLWSHQPYRLYLAPGAWAGYVAGHSETQRQALIDANYGITYQRFTGLPRDPSWDNGFIRNTSGGNVHPNSWATKSSFGSDYFEYGMSALAMCVNQNVPGAVTAFSRILSAVNYNSCKAGLSNDPRWGIAPRA
ncbi:MAG: hypothetical protein REI94_09880 [Moraxellaceae bacterium]|nr:hypothetical protein [Moraxellaceae bacterium]